MAGKLDYENKIILIDKSKHNVSDVINDVIKIPGNSTRQRKIRQVFFPTKYVCVVTVEIAKMKIK